MNSRVYRVCGLWIMDYEVMKEWSSRNNDSSDGDRMDGLMDGWRRRASK